MVLKLGKKPAAPKPAPIKAAPEPEEQQAEVEDPPFDTDDSSDGEQQAAAPTPTPVAKAVAQKTGGLSFIKRGAAAKEGLAREDKKAEVRRNRIDRYWIPTGKTDGDVTFLDGMVKEGVLDIPFYHEHNVNMNGHWRNWFICTQDDEPCPICEGGGSAAYVGALTVIDHGEYTDKAGVLVKDRVKLFVAKRDTIKLLQAKALKQGGLRGCRFTVSRIGDKAPACGSSFDFEKKLTEQQLIATYKDKAKPVNYDQYLASIYYPASELRKMGFGSLASPVGSESAPADKYQV